MKNKLTDLNNYLFAQLERLDNEELTGEELTREMERARSIGTIAGQIINNADIQLKAVKIQLEYGQAEPQNLKLLTGLDDE